MSYPDTTKYIYLKTINGSGSVINVQHGRTAVRSYRVLCTNRWKDVRIWIMPKNYISYSVCKRHFQAATSCFSLLLAVPGFTINNTRVIRQSIWIMITCNRYNTAGCVQLCRLSWCCSWLQNPKTGFNHAQPEGWRLFVFYLTLHRWKPTGSFCTPTYRTRVIVFTVPDWQ